MYAQLNDKQKRILRAAINKYGEAAQVDMAIEEMSELIKALLKERRKHESTS